MNLEYPFIAIAPGPLWPGVVVLEIIYWVSFYMLKNKQSQATMSTSAVPPHVHMFFKLTDLFYLLTPTIHMRTAISWETLCTWRPKILLLQAFEFVCTSHQNWKNCYQDKCYSEKHLFFAIILFFFTLFLSQNISPFLFFNQIVVLFLFSCHISCYSKPYFSLHCRYWFRPILNW